MGAGQARSRSCIGGRRPRSGPQLEADYDERLLNPYVAAERGYVDAVIEPADTRARDRRARSRCSTTSSESLAAAASTTTRRSDVG